MAMQKKEKIRGGAAGTTKAEGGGAIGPGAALVTLGLFLLPGGRPGRRLAGAADDDLLWPEWCCSCSYFHEGDPDLAVPPESQGSDENHQPQPCEQGKSLGKL
jgi:hypothetical protein